MKRRRERLPQKLTLRPAPQSFMLTYALSSAPAFVCYAALALHPSCALLSALRRMIPARVQAALGGAAPAASFIVLASALLAILALLLQQPRWLALGLLAGGLLPCALLALQASETAAIMASAVFSAGLLLLAELERRATRYVFDDHGLRIEHGLLRRTIRVLPYSSITEIIMIRGPLARLLNIGSILPLTPATSSLAGELEGAENVAPGKLLRAARRSIVPRSLIPFMLYGVREPERVCRLILERGAGGVRT